MNNVAEGEQKLHKCFKKDNGPLTIYLQNEVRNYSSYLNALFTTFCKCITCRRQQFYGFLQRMSLFFNGMKGNINVAIAGLSFPFILMMNVKI